MIGMEKGSTAQALPFFYVGGYVREKRAVIPGVAVGMHRSRTMRGKRELGI